MYIGSSVILLLGDLLCIIFFKYKYKRDSIRSSPDSIILVLVIIGTIISIIVGISVSPDKLINIFFIFLGSYAIIFTTWFSYKFVEEQVKSAANLGYYLSLLKKEKTLLARLMTVSRMFEADSQYQDLELENLLSRLEKEKAPLLRLTIVLGAFSKQSITLPILGSLGLPTLVPSTNLFWMFVKYVMLLINQRLSKTKKTETNVPYKDNLAKMFYIFSLKQAVKKVYPKHRPVSSQAIVETK